MINTYRVAVLFALLATSSTVAWAETSVSPVPIIVAKEGSVVYVGKDGPRILADCLQNSDSRMLGGPERGKIVRDQLARAKASSRQSFMHLAGTVRGPRELSRRKGFSRG